jgi:hypothetical protein
MVGLYSLVTRLSLYDLARSLRTGETPAEGTQVLGVIAEEIDISGDQRFYA